VPKLFVAPKKTLVLKNSTLVPKHVGDGTRYEVCFVICFTVF